MALIKCSECGADISNQEKNCPNCGKKIEKNKNENVGKILMVIIGIIAIGFTCLFAFSPNSKDSENEIDKETQEVLNMLMEVDWDIDAPNLHRNNKVYITNVSKCDDRYSVDFWYYDYNNKYTTQWLLTNADTGELVNPTVYDGNQDGMTYSGRDYLDMLDNFYGNQHCLEDNRDGVKDTFYTFSEEQIAWLNQNLVVE